MSLEAKFVTRKSQAGVLLKGYTAAVCLHVNIVY